MREDWLGARAPPPADGAADARAGRRETTASRRIRPADASQAPDGEKRPCAGDRDERAGREDATNPRGSAAGFRKTRARPKRGRVDAAATGGEGNLPIAEPPWRKAQRAPALEPRPPETGRAYPPHTPTPDYRFCMGMVDGTAIIR